MVSTPEVFDAKTLQTADEEWNKKEAADKLRAEAEQEKAKMQFSPQTQAEFMQYAVQDDETGEYYMAEEEFANAIAPPNEDYVSYFVFCV